MNRSNFLKTLGVGTVGCALTPVLLKAEEPITADKKVELAIDVEALRHLSICGGRLTIADVMKVYHETGFLLYSSAYGNAPIVLKGEVKVIDLAKK
jgi:hypothetical protein